MSVSMSAERVPDRQLVGTPAPQPGRGGFRKAEKENRASPMMNTQSHCRQSAVMSISQRNACWFPTLLATGVLGCPCLDLVLFRLKTCLLDHCA